MSLNWTRKDYFDTILKCDENSITALEYLVDDLHLERERTVNHFLCHNGSEDFLWALIQLLSYDDVRVAGNAAYILGMLAESELGCYRILHLLKKHTVRERSALEDLLDMLQSEDAESVMNAAGTIGTLAETVEGRDWMLESECVDKLLSRMAVLLDNDNIWTASNAALVLARLTISMLGAGQVLNHQESEIILSKLVQALGLDEAGRGMNAAFAIGRMCDLTAGRNRLLEMADAAKMITSLSRMLSCTDTGASKNACFALSCLATTAGGHARVMSNCDVDHVLSVLTGLLVATDIETSWFAAMTMRTIASQPAGCLRMRNATKVVSTLKELITKDQISPDLRDEILATLDILKRLEKPNPPRVTVVSGESVGLEWDKVSTKSGLTVKYQLFEGARLVFQGAELSTVVGRLSPNSQYSFRVRALTEGDESPPSDNVLVTTEEMAPSAPTQLRVMGSTTTQLKLLWEPPEHMNGTLRGYYVYCEKKQFEHTQELTSILTGLTPATVYDVSVCAATSKGKGDRAHASGTTSELGAHAPAKPTVNVIGRNEIFISWEPPDNPLGKINRYDLSMNGKVIYSGTELSFTALRLHPDTEYSFTVSALTNEGRCESKPTKKRTSKDEFDDSTRAPLYQSPSRRGSDALMKAPRRASVTSSSVTRRRKSTTDVRVKSAKVKSEDPDKRPTRKSVNRRTSLQLTHRPESEGDSPPKPTMTIEIKIPQSEPPPIPPAQAFNQSTSIPESPEPIGGPPADDVTISPSPPAPADPLRDPLRDPLTRSMTTLNLQAPLTQPRLQYADPVEVLTRTRSHSIPTDFLKRANTFAGNHRPSVQKQMNRHLRTEYAHSRPLPAHLGTKFVPMQMRTQPSNLPRDIKKALSGVKMADNGCEYRSVEPPPRSQYDVRTEASRLSIETEIERLAVGSRRVNRDHRDHRAERSAEEIFNKSYTGYRHPRHVDHSAITSAR